MPRSTRQRMTGIVVNAHCNVERAEVPDFRSHLEGRVAWVEQVNPARGAKLRRLFAQIAWS